MRVVIAIARLCMATREDSRVKLSTGRAMDCASNFEQELAPVAMGWPEKK